MPNNAAIQSRAGLFWCNEVFPAVQRRLFEAYDLFVLTPPALIATFSLMVALLAFSKGGFPLLLATCLSGFGITRLFAGMEPFSIELLRHSRRRDFAMGFAYNDGSPGGGPAPYAICALASTRSGGPAGLLSMIVAFALSRTVLTFSPETKGWHLS